MDGVRSMNMGLPSRRLGRAHPCREERIYLRSTVRSKYHRYDSGLRSSCRERFAELSVFYPQFVDKFLGHVVPVVYAEKKIVTDGHRLGPGAAVISVFLDMSLERILRFPERPAFLAYLAPLFIEQKCA